MARRVRVAVAAAIVAGLVTGRGWPGGTRCTVTVRPGDDVQRALDAGGPAVVCLAPGEFRVRRFLWIGRDGVTLRGAGPGTVLRLDAGVESPVVVIGDVDHEVPARPVAHVTVERLRLVGAGAMGGEVLPEHPYVTNSVLVVRAGRHVAIRDVEVAACRSACRLTERDTRDVVIERTRVEGSVWDGIALNRTARARLAGNEIRGNTAAGITAEHLTDSVVEGNVIAGNRTHGIYLSDSYRNRVVGNRFERNVLSGVFLTCAVRIHAPTVVCWDGSMSAGNEFAGNRFVGNRVGFTAAPNAAATCTGSAFAVNRSRGDRFAANPRSEAGPAAYGRCLVLKPGPPSRARTARAAVSPA